MKKRILSCLMALALCLTLLPTAALAEETEGTAETPPVVEKAADPANGEAKQENQSAEQEEQQEDSASKQAVAAVQAMIDALPDAAELDGMDGEARESACFAASEAYEAYDALTEEQQSALTGAEKMIAILKWTTEQVALAAGTEHTNHPICGDSTCTNIDHALPDEKSWVGVSSLNEITEAGHYFLKQSVTISSTWNPVDGVVLCLNGCDITMNGVGYAIYVREDYTFTLCDCKGGGKGGGKITHTKGVDGRGVYVVGTFNMYGGSISGNSAQWGSGVCLDNREKGTVFNMYGGKITGNTATSSGGGGVNVNTKSTFNMYGGSITDNLNTASGDYGGGVYVSQGGIFTVSGKVNITGNRYKDNTVSNVYLYSDKTIQIVGVLDSTASIGVTTKNAVDLGKSVTVATGGANSCTAGNFFADKGGEFGIKVEPDTEATGSVNVNLYNGLHDHPICGGTCEDGANHGEQTWTPVSSLDEITKEGNYYLTQSVEIDTTWKPVDGVVLCLNGNYIEMTNDGDVITVNNGTKFTLTNCVDQGAVMHSGSLVNGHGVVIRAGGTFSLYNAKIYNNQSGDASNDSVGAGVYVNGGTFQMYSGSIRENTALRNGGGVYVDGGEFTMSGGTIEENTSSGENYGEGGGVYINGGTFTMTGGSITNNISRNAGGGVCVWKDATAFTVGGNAKVTGNKTSRDAANDVYLFSGKSITVDGKLDSTAKIGVTCAGVATGKSVTVATGGADSCTEDNFTANAGGAHFIKVEPGADADRVNVNLYNGQPPVETHTHYLCGGDECTEVGSHHDTEKIPFTAWKSTDALPPNPGNYYLTNDVVLDGSNHIPWMPKGNTVLCLNGHKITMKGDTNVITVTNGVNFYLTDCKGKTDVYGQITHTTDTTGGGVLVKDGGKFYMFGGSITDNTASAGGGVSVTNGTFTMYSGEITKNTASEGGGVYAAGKSTFTMYGGSITGNKANSGNAKNGGGVYVGGSSTFTMNGGAKISGNWANYGGGVFVKESGKFTLSGGAKISGNTAQYNGGGVCMNAGVDGKFTMSGGTIGGTESGETNTAKNGGGVYVGGAGAITMHGGEISGNKAAEYGGGVNMDAGAYGKFTMNGGAKIANNTATSGGGVFMRVNSTFTMDGGEISGNEATQDGGSMEAAGGGVCVAGGTFTVSGSATVTGNKKSGGTANNVYLYSNKSITIGGTLDNGASIGVTTAGKPAEDGITIATSAQDGDENRFTSDAGYQITYDNGTVVLKASAPTPPPTGHTHCLCGKTHTAIGGHETEAQTTFTAWTSTDSLPDTAANYYLTDNVTLSSTWKPADGTVLCLNGHSIKADGLFDAITVNSGVNFTLCDCKGEGDAYGQITHAARKTGSGVYVRGVFHMYGGSISGNTADQGGGVYIVNDGAFNLFGGSIGGTKDGEANTAKQGGGVYMNGGMFEMSGDASITGNTTTTKTAGHGGGVYVNEGTFTMSGNASIKNNNTADESYGGGVYVGGGTFTMNGSASITGNTANQGGGVFASAGKFIMSGGSITDNDGNGVCVSKKDIFTVSGTPTVKENKRNSDASNVWLDGGAYITIGKNGLTDGASIGVTSGLSAPVTVAKGADSYIVTEKDAEAFFSDLGSRHIELKIELKNTVVQLCQGAPHEHYLCGGGSCNPPHGVTHPDCTNKTKFTEIKTLDELKAAAKNGGEYYLSESITLNETLEIKENLTLCLNGQTIMGADAQTTINVSTGKTFVLTDCKSGGRLVNRRDAAYDSRGVYVDGGSFTMYHGTVDGFAEGVRASSKFVMYGGSIVNSRDYGVHNSGTFEMYGGKITGNGKNAPNSLTGCGVYDNGTMTVGGDATIRNNTNGSKDPSCNVCLAKYSNGKLVPITVKDDFTGSFGVTTSNPPYKNLPHQVTTGGTTNTITADNTEKYKIVAKDGNLWLQVKDTGGGTTPSAHEHTYGAWSKDATHHWHECTDDKCPDKPGSIKDKEAHIYTDDADTTCNVCGYARTVTPEIVPVTQITLNKTSTSISVGNSEQLIATVTPENANNKRVTWTSSDTSVATVENGTVTAVKAGTAAITATAADGSGKSATCTVTVTGGTAPSQPGGSSSGSGGGGGGSSSDRDSSDSNPVIKTETKTNANGSTTKTETRRDGSVTQTTTGKDGSVSKMETKPNGSSVTENKAADGSTGTVKTDKNGQTEAAAKVSGKAVEDAKKNGEAVKAPVEVEASRNSNTAPTVKVELPKGTGETKVEIPVSNVKPGTVAVLVHPDGTEEILKNSIPTEDGIQLTVDGNATVKIVDNSKGFIDTRNHWAEDAIDFVSARGLVNGMSDTIYAPNNSTTRAQLWTILARQNDADLSGGSIWYEKAQNWAKSEGVSDGANPNAAINRAQMVTMLWRAVGQSAPATAATFTDVPADAYYAGAVSWAVENGITTGVGGGKFDPTGACTRAQIAAFLARLYAEK